MWNCSGGSNLSFEAILISPSLYFLRHKEILLLRVMGCGYETRQTTASGGKYFKSRSRDGKRPIGGEMPLNIALT